MLIVCEGGIGVPDCPFKIVTEVSPDAEKNIMRVGFAVNSELAQHHVDTGDSEDHMKGHDTFRVTIDGTTLLGRFIVHGKPGHRAMYFEKECEEDEI